jgi:hypothetical protein
VFKYQYETRHEVVHHVLQTKPDAYAEGADQECHFTQIHTGGGQGDEKAQQQNAVPGKEIHSAGHTAW